MRYKKWTAALVSVTGGPKENEKTIAEIAVRRIIGNVTIKCPRKTAVDACISSTFLSTVSLGFSGGPIHYLQLGPFEFLQVGHNLKEVFGLWITLCTEHPHKHLGRTV